MGGECDSCVLDILTLSERLPPCAACRAGTWDRGRRKGREYIVSYTKQETSLDPRGDICGFVRTNNACCVNLKR